MLVKLIEDNVLVEMRYYYDGGYMLEESTNIIPQMVEDMRAGKLSRRNFMKALTSLGISAAGVTTIVAAASTGPAASASQVVHPDQEREQNLQFHEQHLANQMQGNTGMLENDYAEHAIVEDSMFAQPFVGRAAIIARKRTGMAAIPDLQINVTNRIAYGSQVVVEWVSSGTHSGDFPGLPASGKPFSIRGLTVVVREGGKIVREAIYYDMREVQRQLGF